MLPHEADITPLSFIGKSEIVRNADTAEIKAEAKREAQHEIKANQDRIVMMLGTYGEYPDGTGWERIFESPEEQEEYEAKQAEYTAQQKAIYGECDKKWEK